MKRVCIGCVFFAAALADFFLIRFYSFSITGVFWSPFVLFGFGILFIYNSFGKEKKLVKESREKMTDIRKANCDVTNFKY